MFSASFKVIGLSSFGEYGVIMVEGGENELTGRTHWIEIIILMVWVLGTV